MRPSTTPFALAASLACLTLSCQLDKDVQPKKPVIHYSLSDATTAVDADTSEPAIPPDVQANIAGSLEMLFGSPAAPQFLLMDEWIDEGYDPNWPTDPKGEQGSGEFDEAALQVLWKDNERSFRRELALIDAADYDDVRVPDWLPSLQSAWAEMLARPAEGRNAEFKAEARTLFIEFYPRLRDSSEMYRQQCLHCHGPEGGGNGPTARFLEPRPRDYRLGTFKFTAVGKSVPRRADLFHILDEGVTGTAMPSFRRFAKAQLHGLVDYVRLLAMRGMVERDLVNTFKNADPQVLTLGNVQQSYADAWEKWHAADGKLLAFEGEVPAPTAESIERGRVLFMDAKSGNCFSCHGAEGRGDGASAFQLDPESHVVKPAYKDDWGNEIVPRNIRYGVFRGGRRPIDIYRRVKNGIAGTPMPEAASTLTPEDLWALVHFVGSISERPHHAPVSAATHGEHGSEPAKH